MYTTVIIKVITMKLPANAHHFPSLPLPASFSSFPFLKSQKPTSKQKHVMQHFSFQTSLLFTKRRREQQH